MTEPGAGIAPNTPSRGEECGGLYNMKWPPCGTTYKLAISRDPQQKYLYVADGSNNEIHILLRSNGKQVGSFGRQGRNAGEFHWVHAIAIDSRGNLFSGEVDTGKRVQKFTRQR